MVKQLHFDIESSGTLSIQVLQAAVLIALYELGHAIYPAALLSVGRCARYATALDINKPTASLGSIKLPWIEEEESRRVWWAIAILDRFLNLCNPGQHFVTQDPDSETYLPVDDMAWDSGMSKPEDALTIGSSSGFHLGRFARRDYTVTAYDYFPGQLVQGGGKLETMGILHSNGSTEAPQQPMAGCWCLPHALRESRDSTDIAGHQRITDP
ncbi:hypothetical protein V490_00506 [Pseudogymnoascus sp. VKM F-3557]|nr:hypothetical protein V490_00506 [Pseudogymnoascus sp. VKM F-3557]